MVMSLEERCDVIQLKKRLLAYREKERDIEIQIERLDRMETRLVNVGAQQLSALPRSPSPAHDRTAAMIAQKLDLEENIRRMLKEAEEEREWIESVVSHLTLADERNVIRMRYIDGESWSDVVDTLFGNRIDYIGKEDSYMRRTVRLHKDALQNMVRYLVDCSV